MKRKKKEKIDLHGLRHKDVKWIIIKKIESLWLRGTELEIVTGYSDEMIKIVTGVLDEYNLEYRVGDFFNRGYIRTIV